MTRDLVAMALGALDDEDARRVFADAIREADWWDDRIAIMIGTRESWARKWFLHEMSRHDVLIIYACMTQQDRGEGRPGGVRYRLNFFIEHFERQRARKERNP